MEFRVPPELSAALGFDGDDDRCGVVDNEGEEIFARVQWNLEHGLEVRSALAAARPPAVFAAE